MNESSKKIIKWYDKYKFNIQMGNRHVNLFSTTQGQKKSHLSPLTDFILNTLINSQKRVNYIINFPNFLLKPLPLIAFILAEKYRGTILIYCNKKTQYYKIYHEIKWNNYQFLWEKVPAAILKGDKFKIMPKVSFADRNYRSQIREKKNYFKNRFLCKESPKVIFCDSSPKLTDKIKDFYIYNQKVSIHNIEQDLNIKYIIFEAFNNQIYNDYTLELFKDMIDQYPKHSDINFLYHISDPDYKYLDTIYQNFGDIYEFSFHPSFIYSNSFLQDMVTQYHSKINQMVDYKYNNINRVNIDKEFYYTTQLDDKFVIRDSLEVGNVDSYFFNCTQIWGEMETFSLSSIQYHMLSIIRSLVYKSFRLLCIPKNFSVYHFTEYFRIPLKDFLPTIKSKISNEFSGLTKIYMEKLCGYLESIVVELSECKRYQDSKSFTRIGKNYALFDFLEKNVNKSKHIIIGVLNGEKKYIQNTIKTFFSKSSIEVRTIDNIQKYLHECQNKILVLGGALLPSQFDIMFRDWDKIFLFSYTGNQKKQISNQISKINQINISKHGESVYKLSRISKDLIYGKAYNIENDSIYKAYIEEKKYLESRGNNITVNNSQKVENKNDDISRTKSHEIPEKDDYNLSISNLCRKIFSMDKLCRNMIEEEDLDKEINIYEEKEREKQYEESGITCEANLIRIDDGKVIIKNIDIHKKYMYFSNPNNPDIKYLYPHALSKRNGYLIVLKNKKESLLSLIENIYNFDVNIDFEIINQWQRILSTYYLQHYNKYKSFYQDVKNNSSLNITYNSFKDWIKGEINSPQDPYNLLTLGKFMRNSFLQNNYLAIHEEGKKIQKYHIKLSRQLKKLIKAVLERKQTQNYRKFSIEEQKLLRKIYKCIYKIKKISVNFV